MGVSTSTARNREKMTNPQFSVVSFLSSLLRRNTGNMLILALLSGAAFAQSVSLASLNGGPLNSAAAGPAPAASEAVVASPTVAKVLPEAPSPHKFWDNENRVLFASVAVLSAADFALTRSILQNGGKELNPVTRVFSGSTAGLAVNFAGQTAGIIGISYLFHKTGHHQLERLTPMLNIGASSFAVAYDLGHR
jgi:hypothetical protein